MAISESKKPLESQQFHMIQPNMCNSTCIISILIFTLHIFSILPWNYKLLKNKNFNPDWCFIYSYSSLPGLAPSAGRLGRVQFWDHNKRYCSKPLVLKYLSSFFLSFSGQTPRRGITGSLVMPTNIIHDSYYQIAFWKGCSNFISTTGVWAVRANTTPVNVVDCCLLNNSANLTDFKTSHCLVCIF